MSNVSTTTAAIYQAVLDSLNSSGECGVLPPAPPGKSAYEVAVDNGFVGSEKQWLNSLTIEQENEIARLEARIVNAEKITKGREYAANRLVGTELGQVPLVGQIPSLLGTAALLDAGSEGGNVLTMHGDRGINGWGYGADSIPEVIDPLHAFSQRTWIFKGNNLTDAPSNGWYIYETYTHNPDAYAVQVAYNLTANRNHIRRQAGGVWGPWLSLNSDVLTYNRTTAAGANVVVAEGGQLSRSTSSERYKNVLSDLTLDDAAYADAMQVSPIVYRSLADADNPDYHYYSFSAEALGAYDPAFILWRNTETVTDEEGNTTEQPLDERVAEGLNLNAIVAFLHATNVKQGKIITDLEKRLSSLETAPQEELYEPEPEEEPIVEEEVPVEEDPKD